MNEKGGFPLNELAISALIFLALIAAGLTGLLTGNWIAIKVIAGFLVLIIIAALVFNFFEDLAYTRRVRGLYKDLIRFLELAKENNDASAIEDAVMRVQNHKEYPTVFRSEAAKLVDLYRQVHASQREVARSILLKSIPFDLQALVLFLAVPVVDYKSETCFRHWLGCKAEVLDDVLEIFKSCLEDESRNDHAVLLTLMIGLAKAWPTPEYAAALKPFRPYFEVHYEKITGSDHEQLDRYVQYWDAKNADTATEGS